MKYTKRIVISTVSFISIAVVIYYFNFRFVEFNSKESIKRGIYSCPKKQIQTFHKYEREINQLSEYSNLFTKMNESNMNICIGNCLKSRSTEECAMFCGVEIGIFTHSQNVGNLRREYQNQLDKFCK